MDDFSAIGDQIFLKSAILKIGRYFFVKRTKPIQILSNAAMQNDTLSIRTVNKFQDSIKCTAVPRKFWKS